MITYPLPEERQNFTMIREDEPYTFSDYFKLGLRVSQAVEFHGYTLERRYLTLPQLAVDQLVIERLRERIKLTLPHVSLNNETARREFLIAPLLQEVVIATKAEVVVEFPINVTDQLRGTLDYWLEGRHNVVIIEAKQADLELGFTQLATELIALDQWEKTVQPYLLGAVSIGDSWRFGLLERERKLVVQDLQLYTVPDDLEQVLGILVAELKGEA